MPIVPPAPQTPDPVDRHLFAGKAFYITEGLFKEYEDKLRGDIKLYGGSLVDSLRDANYILHKPPSAHMAWYKEFTSLRQDSQESSSELFPVIRPYHWFYTCIHSRPPRVIRTTDPEYTKEPSLLQFERYLDDNGQRKEITRPLRIYCTVNMPPLHPQGDEPSSLALQAVIRKVEAYGAFRSLKRATADILLLDRTLESGKKFAAEAKGVQTVGERAWFEGLVGRGKRPYVRGRPAAGGMSGTGTGQGGNFKQIGGVPGGSEMVGPVASGSKTKLAAQGEADEGWLKKPSVPFKGPTGGRTDFTEKDEDFILRWLMYHYPQKTNWKSIVTYRELCDKTHAKHLDYADRHTYQSWHERVRKRYPSFSARSAQYAGENVSLDRQLRTRAERAALGEEDGQGADVRAWMRGVGRPDQMDRADKGKGKAVGGAEAVEDAARSEDDTDSFASSEDANPNGKRKRVEKSLSPVVESEGEVPVQKRAKQTSDDTGPAEPGPHATNTVQSSTADAQVTVVVEETQVVTEKMVIDSELANPTEPPAETGIALQEQAPNTTTTNTSVQPEEGESRPGSPLQDQNIILDVVSTVVDAVATAFTQTISDPESPQPEQNQNRNQDQNQEDETQMQATQGEDQDSFLLADDDEMEARMIAEQRRARAKAEGGNKRLSTLSERMVNDLIGEDEGEVSSRSEVEVEGGQQGVLEQTRNVSDVDEAAGEEELVVPTRMADQPTSAPAPAPVADPRPPATPTPTPIEPDQQDPRRRATSSAPSTTSRRRPVQTPERAAHILAKTTKKFGIDVRTVLSAMQYVMENDREGQIPVPELWRLLEEDRVAGWGRFGSGSGLGGKRKA